MKYDLLLHLVGWETDPDEREAIGRGVRLSTQLELPNIPSVGMTIQYVGHANIEFRGKSGSIKSDVEVSGIFEVEELLFHVQKGSVVTVFLSVDWRFDSLSNEEYDYLPLHDLEAIIDRLSRDESFGAPPNRVEAIDGSFLVHFTENIHILNSSGEQRVVSAWTNIQTPLVPLLGSRLRFSAMQSRFEMTQSDNQESLTPYDDERIVTRVFHSNVDLRPLTSHIHTGIESDLLYEVDVEDFEAEVERVTQALLRKTGFELGENGA